MVVESWTDTSIVASLPGDFIEPDHYGDVTLEVHPNGAPTIQVTGCNFYAVREVHFMVTLPESQVSLAAIKDLAANNVSVGYGLLDCGQLCWASMVVGRQSPASFPSAQDTFNFSKMRPGFYVKNYQPYYYDVTDPKNLAIRVRLFVARATGRLDLQERPPNSAPPVGGADARWPSRQSAP